MSTPNSAQPFHPLQNQSAETPTHSSSSGKPDTREASPECSSSSTTTSTQTSSSGLKQTHTCLRADMDYVPELISDDARDLSDLESEPEYMYDFEEDDDETTDDGNVFDPAVRPYNGQYMRILSPSSSRQPTKATSSQLNKGGFSTMGGLRLPLKKAESEIHLEEDDDLY